MNLPDYLLIIITFFIAFAVSKILIPVLLTVARQKRLFEDCNDDRKIHTGNIPSLGGVAIFTAFMVVFSASSYASILPGYEYIVSASILLFAAGLKDDLILIAAHKKLGLQVLAAALIIFGAGVSIDNLGGVFGIYEISPWIEIPLSFFTIIVVVNAINLIDGIDALAGSIGFFASLFFGAWFYLAGLMHLAAFSFILAASISGFLWYNKPPAKIFMGDTGSLIIGFFLSIMAIKFLQLSLTEPNVVFWQPAAPVIAAAVLVVPLYDTLRVFIVRKLKGLSAFEPDNEHIHHQLLDVGFTHGKTVATLLTINIVIVASIIFLSSYVSNTVLLGFLLAFSMLLLPTYNWKRKLLTPFVSESLNEIVKSSREQSLSEGQSESNMDAEIAEDELGNKELQDVKF